MDVKERYLGAVAILFCLILTLICLCYCIYDKDFAHAGIIAGLIFVGLVETIR